LKCRSSASTAKKYAAFSICPNDFREARNAAISDSAKREFSVLGLQAVKSLDEKTWLDESHALAKSHVYTEEILTTLRRLEATAVNDSQTNTIEPIILSDSYLKVGGHVAQERIMQAGYRLGAVLKELVPE